MPASDPVSNPSPLGVAVLVTSIVVLIAVQAAIIARTAWIRHGVADSSDRETGWELLWVALPGTLLAALILYSALAKR